MDAGTEAAVYMLSSWIATVVFIVIAVNIVAVKIEVRKIRQIAEELQESAENEDAREDKK